MADDVIVDKPNAKEILDFTKEIEYKNVWFAYHKGDDGYVLRDINLKIQKGKTVALVGQSGSGENNFSRYVATLL